MNLVSLMKYYSKQNSNQEQDFYNNIIKSNLTIKLKVELSQDVEGYACRLSDKRRLRRQNKYNN